MEQDWEKRLKNLEDLREIFPGDTTLSEAMDYVIEKYEQEENGQQLNKYNGG